MRSLFDNIVPCLINPIGPSVVSGGVLTAFDALTGRPAVSIRVWGFYSCGIYLYNIIQCPMEAISGRQSSLHNVASAGLLGYIGVTRGVLSVPFVDPFFLYRSRYPALIAAAVYGGIGGALATLGGKPI